MHFVYERQINVILFTRHTDFATMADGTVSDKLFCVCV